MEEAEPGASSSEIRARIEQLRVQEDELAAVLTQTKDARRRVAAERRALEVTLNWIQGGGQHEDPQRYAIPLGDAARDLLTPEKGAPSKTMTVTEMTRLLQNARKLPATESAYQTLYKTLTRDKRFKKVEGKRGYWTLASPP